MIEQPKTPSSKEEEKIDLEELKAKFEKSPQEMSLSEMERLASALKDERGCVDESRDKKPKDYVEIEKEPRNPVEAITLIKHKIGHLLLPTTVDFEGATEVFKQDPEKAKIYLDEVLEEKKKYSDKYYSELLENIRKLIGLEEGEKYNIEKYIQELRLENHEAWQTLKKLAGSESVINSPVYPLFDTLDRASRGKLGPNINSIVEFFNNLESLNDESLQGCKDDLKRLLGEKDQYSFRDWVVALDESLDELRKTASER